MTGAIEAARGNLRRIDELLEASYGSAELGNLNDALDETIYILLSQQTRDAVYRRVFVSLRKRWPRWIDLLAAKTHSVEEVLRPAGFHRRRARMLVNLLKAVDIENRSRRVGPYAQQPADLTLEFLHGFMDADAEAFLVALPGIGPKSARCVLSYALRRPAFAVDTHVARMFDRLGLAKSAGRKKDHDPFQQLVEPRMRQRLHINMVHHGRAVCRSSRPRCGDCVLVSFCEQGKVATARQRAESGKPVALDLFAGAGGLADGFRRAGFAIGGAIEADRNAAQTYRYNHPGTPVIEALIGSRLNAASIRRRLPGLDRVDAILAGPPCQGYSAAGSRRADDPRNDLYRHVARIARTLDAPVVVLENVPGLRRVRGHSFIPIIEKAFRANGYEAPHHLLQASHFGVSQRRQRYFFLIFDPLRIAFPPDPPSPSHRAQDDPEGVGAGLPETPRVDTMLAALPVLPPGVSAETFDVPDFPPLYNMSTMRHSVRVVGKISRIPGGQGPISYRRLDGSQARTLIAGHRALPVHPTEHRTISVREAAMIQGFEHRYRFLGPRADQPLQVANAVPPPLAHAVARRVLVSLTKSLPDWLCTPQSPSASMRRSWVRSTLRRGPGSDSERSFASRVSPAG